MSDATEPFLDLSEIVGMYKEDALRMISEMRDASDRWAEVASGGPARKNLQRLSHQLRGSGRTYGFRRVTRISKALEHVMQKIEKQTIRADQRTQDVVKTMVDGLAVAFQD